MSCDQRVAPAAAHLIFWKFASSVRCGVGWSGRCSEKLDSYGSWAGTVTTTTRELTYAILPIKFRTFKRLVSSFSENIFDVLANALVLALTLFSLVDIEGHSAGPLLAAATQMVMFIRFFLFLRGFEATGFLGTMLFRVIGATKQYFALFVMLWVVAAEIFYVLLGFKSLSQSVEFTGQ